jgi:hypothetical protein
MEAELPPLTDRMEEGGRRPGEGFETDINLELKNSGKCHFCISAFRIEPHLFAFPWF